MKRRVRASWDGRREFARATCGWRERRARISTGVAAAVVLALTSPAIAATYYVRASGDDARDGLTPETALASIRLTGRRLLAPGDRVIVGPGTYHEGNIEPYGSGTPDAPIAFSADESGLVTHDPPGPVIIRPPNTFDATTGFIVFGKHDIVIEGFTIEGARDPGIQVRPHFSTGVDSTRVTVRNNWIQYGLQRGIHIIAAGDATIIGNRILGHPQAAISLYGGTNAPVRPFLEGNNIERNNTAIQIERAFGTAISDNRMDGNQRGILLTEGDGLSITRNDVSGRSSINMSSSADVDIRDNGFGGGVQITASGTVRFEKNQVLSGGLGLSSDTTAILRVLENKLPHVIIYNGTRLDFEHNEAFIFRALYVEDMKIVDNNFQRRFAAFALANLELSRNHASRIDAAGAETLVTDNEASQYIQISTDSGIVKDNSANFISVSALSEDQEAGGLILVEGNDSKTEMKVGMPKAPVSRAIVQHNSVGESLLAFAEKQLEVRHNVTSGIECGAMNAGSQLLVSRNTTRNSLASGIRVVSASQGRIESNISSANEEFGLEVRLFDTLTVVDNEFSSNGYGGILAETILTRTGDCNGDGEVPVAEVITTVGIALGQRTLRDCAAVDVDGNERVTIGELIASVAASLGTADPAGIGNGRIEILSNRVEANRRFGINLFAQSVLAKGNDVVGNEGIALAVHSSGAGAPIEIKGNLLGSGSGEGIFLKGTRAAHVRNNFVFSNGEAGILLRDAPGVTVVNNLIYDNGDDGIAVGRGTVLPAADAVIMNNTLYANRGFGVTIGSSEAPSPGTMLLNNIVDGNAQGGVASDIDSLPGLTIGFNLNNDGYSHEVASSVTDFTADPRFVSPEGSDEVLGRDGFADDDFHVQSDSAAIDAGSATAAELGITGSAVQGQATDEGVVDLGFHYGADPPSEPSPLSRL